MKNPSAFLTRNAAFAILVSKTALPLHSKFILLCSVQGNAPLQKLTDRDNQVKHRFTRKYGEKCLELLLFPKNQPQFSVCLNYGTKQNCRYDIMQPPLIKFFLFTCILQSAKQKLYKIILK